MEKHIISLRDYISENRKQREITLKKRKEISDAPFDIFYTDDVPSGKVESFKLEPTTSKDDPTYKDLRNKINREFKSDPSFSKQVLIIKNKFGLWSIIAKKKWKKKIKNFIRSTSFPMTVKITEGEDFIEIIEMLNEVGNYVPTDQVQHNTLNRHGVPDWDKQEQDTADAIDRDTTEIKSKIESNFDVDHITLDGENIIVKMTDNDDSDAFKKLKSYVRKTFNRNLINKDEYQR